MQDSPQPTAIIALFWKPELKRWHAVLTTPSGIVRYPLRVGSTDTIRFSDLHLAVRALEESLSIDHPQERDSWEAEGQILPFGPPIGWSGPWPPVPTSR